MNNRKTYQRKELENLKTEKDVQEGLRMRYGQRIRQTVRQGEFGKWSTASTERWLHTRIDQELILAPFAHLLMHYGINAWLNMFSERGAEAFTKELKQNHDMEPKIAKDLTSKQRKGYCHHSCVLPRIKIKQYKHKNVQTAENNDNTYQRKKWLSTLCH